MSRLAARPPEGLGLDAAAQHLTLAVRGGLQTWQAPVTAEGDSLPSPGKGGEGSEPLPQDSGQAQQQLGLAQRRTRPQAGCRSAAGSRPCSGAVLAPVRAHAKNKVGVQGAPATEGRRRQSAAQEATLDGVEASSAEPGQRHVSQEGDRQDHAEGQQPRRPSAPRRDRQVAVALLPHVVQIRRRRIPQLPGPRLELRGQQRLAVAAEMQGQLVAGDAVAQGHGELQPALVA